MKSIPCTKIGCGGFMVKRDSVYKCKKCGKIESLDMDSLMM